jgi:hypothetical protein
MTTNTKLNEILKNRRKFLGVYLYDELDTIDVFDDRCLIVNYVTRAESRLGHVGHYVCIDYRLDAIKGNGNHNYFFFDPYGFAPDEPRKLMGLPNYNYITKFLNKQSQKTHVRKPWSHNATDFQVEQGWDNLCGVYSALYIMNPNFNTNPVFLAKGSRVSLDRDLQQLFDRLQVLGDPYVNLNPRKTKNALETLEKLSNVRKLGLISH